MLTAPAPLSPLSDLDFNKGDGLIPAIVQHASSGAVLMLGYMNRQALAATEQSGNVTFYSRSKKRLWTKGETSGHLLKLVSISTDCDRDSLLILALPKGPTCHLGSDSCFGQHHHQGHFLWQLDGLLESRKTASPDSSYTASLYQRGVKRISQKVGEEGVETALAAVAGDNTELLNEASDLLYHLLTLLHAKNLDLTHLIATLQQRQP